MRIFVDVDGTLTVRRGGKTFFNPDIEKNEKLISKVKKLFDEGHTIVIWTGGGTKYARKVADYLLTHYQIRATAAVGKPHMIIDDETVKWGRRLKRRMVSVDDFVNK
jgi:hydroxymethylpyrimidine pyrophosphatase-like HAD family hydrolase